MIQELTIDCSLGPAFDYRQYLSLESIRMYKIIYFWYNMGTWPFILYLNIICLEPSLACQTKGLETQGCIYGEGTSLHLTLSRNSQRQPSLLQLSYLESEDDHGIPSHSMTKIQTIFCGTGMYHYLSPPLFFLPFSPPISLVRTPTSLIPFPFPCKNCLMQIY